MPSFKRPGVPLPKTKSDVWGPKLLLTSNTSMRNLIANQVFKSFLHEYCSPLSLKIRVIII
jgi:hypothetical protein